MDWKTIKTVLLRIGVGIGITPLLGIGVRATPIDSIGPSGINAVVLHGSPYSLMGRKIGIGQVEIGRPGKFGLDKAVSRNPVIRLAGVFFRDEPAKTDTGLDPHAQNVASIMVSHDKAVRGIAPEARLYSTAIGSLKRNGQPEECLSAQHIALQNGGDIRAINLSFGESLEQDPRPNARLDGNALLTQCIDWSARYHNTLYVVAGNQGKGGISIPTDQFNGVTVAFTTVQDGAYSRIDFANLGGDVTGIASRVIGLESNVGERHSITLVAPGSRVPLLNPDGQVTQSSGTSFAAPHVTATVALLQEYGDREIRQKQPRWDLNARRHEVMKAVLVNAADKLQDSGDGQRLGMNRTIFGRNQRTWLTSTAYQNPAFPLDPELGAGQVNAFRAYLQFQPGAWSPDRPIPAIGWNYGAIAMANGGEQKAAGKASSNPEGLVFQDYTFDAPLKQGSFIAATLTWDRRVELIDANHNDQYDLGEFFRDRGLNNLDLYLMRAEDQAIVQSVGASTSEVDSLEHLFFQIPQTGRYKLRVVYRQRQNEVVQPYALAWWAVPQL